MSPEIRDPHTFVDMHRLLVAAGVTLGFVIVGSCVIGLGRIRLVRSLGLALIIGPLGGWLIVASLALQTRVYGGA